MFSEDIKQAVIHYVLNDEILHKKFRMLRTYVKCIEELKQICVDMVVNECKYIDKNAESGKNLEFFIGASRDWVHIFVNGCVSFLDVNKTNHHYIHKYYYNKYNDYITRANREYKLKELL